jgi:hypothetical protein
MKNKLFLFIVSMVLFTPSLKAQKDTVFVSELYTTHIVFNTEIKYSDASNIDVILASVVENSRTLFALTAIQPFSAPSNVTILESNGNLHTFVIAYCQHPKSFIVDTRAKNDNNAGSNNNPSQSSTGVNPLWKKDAPPLSDVINYQQGLYHLSRSSGKIKLVCENVFTYSDITYVILRLENRSGVSFSVSDATFSIEAKTKNKRELVAAKPVLPKNKLGSLTAAPKTNSRIAYAIEKMSLSEDQALVIRVFEGGEGMRNIELHLSPEDINQAAAPIR